MTAPLLKSRIPDAAHTPSLGAESLAGSGERLAQGQSGLIFLLNAAHAPGIKYFSPASA
ncbi:hypothetical protein [Bilophila sp.]|uniref:hypothetical protein n=1 Tax=Bilophila sp. TaxID=1929485 RepID=UPI003076B5D0